jgi:hypothetical protein
VLTSAWANSIKDLGLICITKAYPMHRRYFHKIADELGYLIQELEKPTV